MASQRGETSRGLLHAGASAAKREVRVFARGRSSSQATIRSTLATRYYDSLPRTARGVLGVPVVQAWHNAEADIARLKAQHSIDRRALETFEEDARKAGVPPGWLREK